VMLANMSPVKGCFWQIACVTTLPLWVLSHYRYLIDVIPAAHHHRICPFYASQVTKMSNTLVLFGTSLLCLYIIAVIRRLYYHPLSRYSGTRLGIAFPTWRKLYRNFRQRGQFLFEIEEMHKQYGPVVRCGVNDIHVNDPEVFLEMTRIGSRFRKDPKFYDRISFRKTSLGFLDPYAHRARHTTLVNAVFSPKKIRDLAELVEQKVAKLVERFERDSQNEFPVNIQKSIKALSMDIISELTMGQSFNCLDHPAYRNIFLEKLHAIFQEMTWIQKILFTVARVSLSSPPWMFRFVHPPTMVMMKELAKPLVRDYIDSKDGAGTESDSGRKSVIIDALVDTTKGDKKLDFDNLCEEIVTLLTAGGDTVSSALIWGIYHICREESVYHALEKELLVAFPAKSPVTYSVAKDLPYLVNLPCVVLRSKALTFSPDCLYKGGIAIKQSITRTPTAGCSSRRI
jgi:cytochrome P450